MSKTSSIFDNDEWTLVEDQVAPDTDTPFTQKVSRMAIIIHPVFSTADEDAKAAAGSGAATANLAIDPEFHSKEDDSGCYFGFDYFVSDPEQGQKTTPIQATEEALTCKPSLLTAPDSATGQPTTETHHFDKCVNAAVSAVEHGLHSHRNAVPVPGQHKVAGNTCQRNPIDERII